MMDAAARLALTLPCRVLKPIDNYMTFCDTDGISTFVYPPERLEDCAVCAPPILVTCSPDQTLAALISHVKIQYGDS